VEGKKEKKTRRGFQCRKRQSPFSSLDLIFSFSPSFLTIFTEKEGDISRRLLLLPND
jgi:hypothetical protein